jgi:hypothetical protein
MNNLSKLFFLKKTKVILIRFSSQLVIITALLSVNLIADLMVFGYLSSGYKQ